MPSQYNDIVLQINILKEIEKSMELKTLLKSTLVLTSIVSTGVIFANTTIVNADDDKYSSAIQAKTQSDLTFIK